jgi:hypothetical protein
MAGQAGRRELEMNEAKTVWWAKYWKDGVEHSWTVRQMDDESDEQFNERVSGRQAWLAANGYTDHNQVPKVSNGNGGDHEEQPHEAQQGQKSIPVISISLAAGGDHPRWVVKGGKLTKFGVTCWPETLEAAGILGHLDPLKDNTPGGRWVAWYTERQNDQGRMVPDKVVRLERTK